MASSYHAAPMRASMLYAAYLAWYRVADIMTRRPLEPGFALGRVALNFHDHYACIVQPVETCLVGSGGFGRSFLAQARRIRLVNARIAVDVTAEAAARAFAASGVDRREIAWCETAAEARAAWEAGHYVAAGRLESAIDRYQILSC